MDSENKKLTDTEVLTPDDDPTTPEDQQDEGAAGGAGAAAAAVDEAEKDLLGTTTAATAIPPANLEATLLSQEDRDRLADEKFQAVEEEFQRTMEELGDDDAMARFRAEYEKLHRTLLKSRDNEKKLFAKCKELNLELSANTIKVQTAVKMSQNDRQTIGNLKKEIKKAWQMVETVNEKESHSKETIQHLKSEISNAQNILEQGAALNVGQENSVNELIRVSSCGSGSDFSERA